MKPGYLLDNKFSILNTLGEKGDISLLNATYEFEMYRLLIFKNSKGNEMFYRNFPFYIIYFSQAKHYGKTDEYMYFAFPYESPRTIDYYLNLITQSPYSKFYKPDKAKDIPKKTAQAMSFEDLVKSIEQRRKASQNELMNHYIFMGMNTGAVKKMLGDILIMNIFADEATSFWTAEAEKAYTRALNRAIEILNYEAARYGANMKISVINHHTQTAKAISRLNDSGITSSVTDAIRLIGKESILDYQNSYKKNFFADEVPIIVALNKKARSCAFTASKYYPDIAEFCLVAREQHTGTFSPATIAHEIVHLFGAKDFYFPAEVDRQAKKHFPDNIMIGGEKVDSLTAYILGWIDHLPNDAISFLESIKHITYKDYQDALNKENTMKNE